MSTANCEPGHCLLQIFGKPYADADEVIPFVNCTAREDRSQPWPRSLWLGVDKQLSFEVTFSGLPTVYDLQLAVQSNTQTITHVTE